MNKSISFSWKSLRGGSWNNVQWIARCTCRLRVVPEYFLNDLGFRVLGRKK